MLKKFFVLVKSFKLQESIFEIIFTLFQIKFVCLKKMSIFVESERQKNINHNSKLTIMKAQKVTINTTIRINEDLFHINATVEIAPCDFEVGIFLPYMESYIFNRIHNEKGEFMKLQLKGATLERVEKEIESAAFCALGDDSEADIDSYISDLESQMQDSDWQ